MDRQTWLHDKMRIAYLSADFHQHATAHLMAELFERHDRSRFEVIGVSFGPDDKSEMRSAARQRRSIIFMMSAVERRAKSPSSSTSLQIDIAVDLKGSHQEFPPRHSSRIARRRSR